MSEDVFGNSFPMSRFAGLSVDQVKAQLGDAFLVVQGSQPASRAYDDETSEVRSIGLPSTRAPMRGLVYTVAKKPVSTFDWVSVGRHENNDVWMPHASVSRFHALLLDDDGAWSVQDAKSANGTFVQNEPVKVNGSGATPVKPGVEIRFGDIITLFLDAAGIVSLATRTRSRNPMPGVGGA